MSVEQKVENGAYLSGEQLVFQLDRGKNKFSIDISQLPLSGKHNMLNTMAAVLTAKALGQDESRFVEVMSDFKNAAHRLEFAGEINQVKFINDSKATNVDSVFYALDSFKRSTGIDCRRTG